MAQPFLKWAGGKRLLLPRLRTYFPDLPARATYFEPFLGGGAVFFDLAPERARLSDANPGLIEAFEVVRDDVESVIEHLSRFKYDHDAYYAIRARQPRSAAARAARFIFLNRTCFNGLYRVNRNGDFNVPMGRPRRGLVICDRAKLRSASTALANAHLDVSDFESSVRRACAGDFVYFDPPYTTAHQNNGFIEYNADVFAWRDQYRLAELSGSLISRGVNVMISNAFHPSITRVYRTQGFERHVIDRFSTIAGSSTKRFLTKEQVFVGGPAYEGNAER